ncbi:cyclic AMP-dependent transcription factor ATF-4 [Cyclopterus lumpus]|uniref:Cyclic AMP-dependent transcription factor ATF-4 n=1 Tax=Cyclopterus lumpus TaxID=8103 RepID=A0A8C2Z6P9_CYCLU|nr:cyclic AMP-dependent transcription factor ATF-4 [Cyclopterus lumpus]
MTLSQLALEDVEALYLGPSFLMADPMGPLLDQDEEALSPSSSLEGKAPSSPPLSFSSYASSPPRSPTPPTHPSLLLGTKAGADPLSLPWLVAGDLLTAHIGADDDDAFAGMDWMSEKINLSEFDLQTLIGSSDEGLGSPDDLLDSDMDLDVDSFDAAVSLPGIPPLPLVDEVVPDQGVVSASEPLSPVAPPFTQELWSDVQDAEKLPLSLSVAILPDPRGSQQPGGPVVLSLPTFVVVLTSEGQPPLVSIPDPSATTPPSGGCDSDSGIESAAGSPARLLTLTAGSSRTKPYSKPESSSSPPSPSAKTPRVKSVSGAPKVEKKLKKMEQNKTAATRYRQKKRDEQGLLGSECDQLEKRNGELAEKVESISREIQYLKDLMEEVRKRRVKSSAVA